MSFGKFASTFALVGAVLYVSGCSPDCRLLCEEQEEADCFADPDDEVDCERYCKHTQDLVTNADCQVDWDVYVLCLDDIEDVCDAYPEPCLPDEDCDDPKCDNEAEELGECIAEYCTEHPRNNECEMLLAP
jgi:hypothetical protein